MAVFRSAEVLVEPWSHLFGLEGKTALVVGGATLFGRPIASLLAKAGAKVLVTNVDLSVAEKQASTLGPTAAGVMMDVLDEFSVSAAFGALAASGSTPEILIYGETAVGAFPLVETTTAHWDHLHNVNLKGAFWTFREGVKHMLSAGRGGRIVAISTMGSLHPVLRGNEAYGSSKAGLNMLVKDIAGDYAQAGILANCVMHGAVPGMPQQEDAAPPEGPCMQDGRLVLGPGRAQDVAAAVLFLVGPSGGYITGQSIVLDGGFLTS